MVQKFRYMMESAWLCVDEDDSSNHSFGDSDVIDSETEAELYSVIHYQENLHSLKCPTFGIENIETSKITLAQNDDKNSEKKITSEIAYLNKLAQKLNPERKKKSDFDSIVPNVLLQNNSEDTPNQSIKKTFLNNKRKRKTDFSVPESPKRKKSTDLNDSSDSDSIIWTEVDSSDKNKLQTNLSKDEDAIYQSCESECLLLKRDEAFLKNLSMPNIKIGENLKDLWFVNNKDLSRPRKNSRRYHDNVEDTCTNCFRKGHNSRICPMPRTIKCFICGGGHQGSFCVNRICGKCLRTGHDSRRCWMPCISYCTLCCMKGHIKVNCPDIWRRYHMTIHPGKIVRGKSKKQNVFPYCWNCGQGGHFGAECKEPRGPKHCFPTWPSVVSYDNPEDILRKRLNSYSDGCCSYRTEAHFNQRNIANEAGNFIARKKNKKKKNKLNLQQCNKIQKAVREKNFPRTPKNNSLSSFSDDIVPESLKQLLTKRQRRKVNNRNRKMKQRLKLLAQINTNENSFQRDT